MWRSGAICVVAACGFHVGGRNGGVDPGAPDAAHSDAALVDAAPCPASYAPSGHRLLATSLLWIDAESACEADAPGASHLVVINDEAERALLATMIQALPGDAWVGIVRSPGGVAPWPWRVVTGGAASFAPWEGSEPNNMSGNQYVAVIRKSSGFLYDYGIDQSLFAVCECDRRSPVAANYN